LTLDNYRLQYLTLIFEVGSDIIGQQKKTLKHMGTDSRISVSLELNDAKADDTAVSNIDPTKQTITFAEDYRPSPDKDKALYIPPPWRRERGI
jgi:hypothetical protein